MRTDGVFELCKYVLPNWDFNRPVRLVPFGDVHRDSPAHSTHKWSEFIERTKEPIETVFLGMGDYTDSYSTSERMIIYNDILHESTREREENQSFDRIKLLANELEGIKGRTIGLLGGNHFVQFADGTTGDQRLANLLGTSYLGVCSAIRLVFGDLHGNTSASIDIFAHHGKGGGQTATGKFNAVEKLTQVCDADIFLMGDNHARGCIPIGDKLRLVDVSGSLAIRSRHAWIGRTGSFLRAYEPGRANYVVDAALVPSNLGWVEFIVTPKRIREGGEDRITVDIKSLQ